MTRKAAIHRAAEKWELAPSFIDEIYGDKKLPKPKSKAVREFLSGDTVDDVDETIKAVSRGRAGINPPTFRNKPPDFSERLLRPIVGPS